MTQKVSIDMLEEQLLCPICLEVFKEPLMLQCGHLSCQPCILSLPRALEGQLLCPVYCQGVACSPLAPSIVVACVIKVL
uniref:RING-type domain-containing protein n=1 Tax=Cyanoderma ruficeps TaxID=181631 RepID=A0A8C3XCP8_9PASS